MSWYPLHDWGRVSPLWRHRLYVTALASLLLGLFALLLVADPSASCLVTTRIDLADHTSDRLIEAEQWKGLAKTVLGRSRLESTCASAGLRPADLGLPSMQALTRRLMLRVETRPGSGRAVVHLGMWSTRPRAAARLLHELSGEVAEHGHQFALGDQRRELQQDLVARETQHWSVLSQAVARYLDAVSQWMDAHLAADDLPTMPAQAATWPISTRGPDEALPLNPQWSALAAELESLEVQMEHLQETYAERHPLVVQLRGTIDRLADKLDQVPMTVAPAPRSGSAASATQRGGRFDTGLLEDTRRELREALDGYNRIRHQHVAPDRDAAATRQGGVPAAPKVTARRGGWQGWRLLGVTLTCSVAGAVLAAGALARQDDVLRSAEHLERFWGGDVIGTVEDPNAFASCDLPRASGDRLLPMVHVAEASVAVGLLVLVLLAALDASFLDNLLHDPRLALREWFVAR